MAKKVVSLLLLILAACSNESPKSTSQFPYRNFYDTRLLFDMDTEVERVPCEIKGKIPSWVAGTLLRNGPAKFSVDGEHVCWFDGLAMLHAFEFSPNRVIYSNRFIRSEQYDIMVKQKSLNFSGFAQDPCPKVFKNQTSRYIPVPLESWSFALARGAPLHPTRPASSFSIVSWAGSDANLPPLALANSPTFNCRQYIPVTLESWKNFKLSASIFWRLKRGYYPKVIEPRFSLRKSEDAKAEISPTFQWKRYIPKPLLAIPNANVTIQNYADKMVALTEVPLPVIFDDKTMDTVGPFQYQDQLPPGQWETAHSLRDPFRGETVSYCINFGEKSSYFIWKMADHQSSRTKIAEIPVDFPAYMHSFALTEHYVVLVAFPLVVNPLDLMLRKKPFIFNNKWKPELGTTFYIVERATGQVVTTKGEPFFAFHHINAYDKEGKIFMDIVTHPNADIIEVVTQQMTDKDKIKISEKTQVERFTVSLSPLSVSRELLFDKTTELPRVPAERVAHEYRFSYLIDAAFPTSLQESPPLYKLDAATKTAQSWSEKGCFPGEPIFVPSPKGRAEDDGVVMSLVLDFAHHRSFLLILDAKEMKELARAATPHAVPVGLHGLWK